MNRPWLEGRMPSGKWAEPTDARSFFGGPKRNLKTTLDRYLAYLMLARHQFDGYVTNRDFGGGHLIAPLAMQKLQNTEELSLIALQAAYLRAYRALPSRESTPIRWAAAVRNLVIFALLMVRPFRNKTMREMLISDIRIDEDGIAYYQVPPERFKAQDTGGSKGGVRGRIPELFPKNDPVVGMYSMHALLGEYLRVARGVLLSGAQTDIMFPALLNGHAKVVSDRGMVSQSMHALVSGFSKKYFDISTGPHALRHIFGTNGRRAGWSYDDIALGLQNTAKMAKEAYAHVTAADRGKRATTMIEELAAKKGLK